MTEVIGVRDKQYYLYIESAPHGRITAILCKQEGDPHDEENQCYAFTADDKSKAIQGAIDCVLLNYGPLMVLKANPHHQRNHAQRQPEKDHSAKSRQT